MLAENSEPRALYGLLLTLNPDPRTQTFGSLIRNDTLGELSNHGTDSSEGPSDACWQ